MLGEEIACFEKATSGCLFVWVIMIVLVGPFLAFAAFSPLVGENGVAHGKITLGIQSNKTVIADSTTGKITVDNPLKDTRGNTFLNPQQSFISYEIYSNKNLYFTKMKNEAFNSTYDYFVTETSFFKPDSEQIQICSATRYPDTSNDLSGFALQQLFDDVALSRKVAGKVNNETNAPALNISLQIEYSFVRPGPELMEQTTIQINRTLNYTQYDDCRAGEELASWKTAIEDCGTDKSFNKAVYIR